MTALAYIKKTIGGDNFMAEYRRLSNEERLSLRAYAEAEMKVLGIEIEESK